MNAATIARPDVTLAGFPTLTTVPVHSLKPGDLIGGTRGEWVVVTKAPAVYRGAYGSDEATVTVAPAASPDDTYPWLVDANASMAVIRGGVA